MACGTPGWMPGASDAKTLATRDGEILILANDGEERMNGSGNLIGPDGEPLKHVSGQTDRALRLGVESALGDAPAPFFNRGMMHGSTPRSRSRWRDDKGKREPTESMASKPNVEVREDHRAAHDARDVQVPGKQVRPAQTTAAVVADASWTSAAVATGATRRLGEAGETRSPAATLSPLASSYQPLSVSAPSPDQGSEDVALDRLISIATMKLPLAVQELQRAGHKTTHWTWGAFPHYEEGDSDQQNTWLTPETAERFLALGPQKAWRDCLELVSTLVRARGGSDPALAGTLPEAD